jgi:hypothetical protein
MPKSIKNVKISRGAAAAFGHICVGRARWRQRRQQRRQQRHFEAHGPRNGPLAHGGNQSHGIYAGRSIRAMPACMPASCSNCSPNPRPSHPRITTTILDRSRVWPVMRVSRKRKPWKRSLLIHSGVVSHYALAKLHEILDMLNASSVWSVGGGGAECEF